MKWFQHNSDSHINLKLQKFCRIFGMEGYGFWWLSCELVANQSNGSFKITKDKDWKTWLELQSKLAIEKIDTMLEKMGEFRLIDDEEYKKGNLFMPKMAEYGDEYTKKKKSIPIVSGEYPDSVGVDKIDKIDNTSKPMTSLLVWAEEKRNGKFPSPKKQFTAMAMMKKAGIEVGKIKERWEEMETEQFWQDKGFDFMNVAKSFDKKR